MRPLLILAAASLSAASLTVSQRSEPRTWNPVTAIDNPSRDLIRLLHADLVHINRQTLATEPALAESWAVSNGGRTFTLQLRRGVRFADGQPFTAADVAFTFEVYLDPATGSPQRDLLVINGKAPRVRVLGENRVAFDFAEPYGPAERVFDSVFILPRHKLEPLYRPGRIAAATADDLPGLGPFRLEKYEPGRRAVFQRNPHFWRAGLPRLDNVIVLFAADQEAEVVRFRGGETDLISRLPARAFEALRRELPGYGFADAGPSLEYHFLFWNLNEPGKPWSSPAFRRAVSLAADRTGMVKLAYGGRAAAIAQPVSPSNKPWFHAGLPVPARNVENARKLLRDAGFRTGDEGALLDVSGQPVSFTLATNAANQQQVQMAALLQQDLKAIGIQVQVTPLEFRSLVDRILKTREYAAAIMALAPGDADPGAEMNVWSASGRSHFWRLDPARQEPWEKEIDAAMQRQMATADQLERRRLFHRVQAIAAEQMPLVCLVSPHLLLAHKPGLRGVKPALLPPFTLANVEEIYWEKKR
jgi:peptide/nickel transport system substrate-binding protein